jgi:urea transporter
MKPWKVNSFTFPFVISTWLFLLASRAMFGLEPLHLSTPTLPADLTTSGVLHSGQLVISWLKCIAQVFLIDNWVTGVLFLVGLLIASRWAAVWAAIGSALSILTAYALGASAHSISHGLYGFSAVLTAIALATVFYRPSWRSALWALMGAVATLIGAAALNLALEPLGLPALTAPFCLATWLFLLPLLKLDHSKAEGEDHSSWHRRRHSTNQQPHSPQL